MAIGIALLLGYRLGINFSSPYKAMDITEFWRRWHISLSSWLRDYIYIPLGGNRKGFFLQLLFLLCTMLVGGFWHGADWKFVFWGAAHGFLLVFHKVWLRIFENRFSKGYYNVLSVLITFFCVNLLWIPFRANSIHDALYMYGNIFTNFSWQQFRSVIENNQLLFLLLVFGYVCTIFPTFLKDKIIHFYYRLNLAFKLLALIVVIQLFLQIKTTVVQPFIYFQF
jgi:D-alanyl-lipoteichoic acid acyltransferase DltB (MBOAT superfamily)